MWFGSFFFSFISLTNGHPLLRRPKWWRNLRELGLLKVGHGPPWLFWTCGYYHVWYESNRMIWQKHKQIRIPLRIFEIFEIGIWQWPIQSIMRRYDMYALLLVLFWALSVNDTPPRNNYGLWDMTLKGNGQFELIESTVVGSKVRPAITHVSFRSPHGPPASVGGDAWPEDVTGVFMMTEETRFRYFIHHLAT